MATIKVTAKERKEAEQKLNRLQNRFYTAYSIMQEVLEEMPQKGNRSEDCQKLTILMALNELDSTINGTEIEDFLTTK